MVPTYLTNFWNLSVIGISALVLKDIFFDRSHLTNTSTQSGDAPDSRDETKDADGCDLVLVTSHFKEDLRWLSKSKYPVVVCSKTIDCPQCPLIKNCGREASAYLNYIVTNYDRLPKRVAFLHGHEDAWHHGTRNVLDTIECARRDAPYASLNMCYFDDRNIHHNCNFRMLHDMWEADFRPFLKRDPPIRVLHDCCAQFIVSRERILRLPRKAYEHWLDMILRDSVGDGGYRHGFVFEYVWHIIFGEPDIVTKEDHIRYAFDGERLAALMKNESEKPCVFCT